MRAILAASQGQAQLSLIGPYRHRDKANRIPCTRFAVELRNTAFLLLPATTTAMTSSFGDEEKLARVCEWAKQSIRFALSRRDEDKHADDVQGRSNR
jgi:hypothetical protein